MFAFVPRGPRIQSSDLIYHAGSRAVDKQPMFDVVGGDREAFLGLLAKVVNRFAWRCYAYCLMGNHFHVILDTPEANISDGMKYLKGNYAMWFNAWRGREGALFERRFWSTNADDEGGLLEQCRYVVLNPVRAGLTRGPEEWRWSSYAATVGLAKAPTFLDTAGLLGWFGGGKAARVHYAQFVGEGIAGSRAGGSSRHVRGLTPVFGLPSPISRSP